MAKKKNISLVANIMMRDNDLPYMSQTLPALMNVCNKIVLMHNGPKHKGYEELASMLGDDDTIIKNIQRDRDYGYLRNIMLGHVEIGEWMLKWDPDELPTGGPNGGGMYALGDYIGKHVGETITNVAIPIYHLVEGRMALKIEYGMHHLRVCKKQSGMTWKGAIHEQPHNPGKTHNIPQNMGIAIVHFSYYSPDRLRRKEEHYARIPGSGHGPGTLFRNIEAGLRELPPNIEFEAPEEWLKVVKELT